MTFFDGDGWRMYEPSCACSREADGVLLVAGIMADKRRNYYVRCATCGRVGSPVAFVKLSHGERAAADTRAIKLADIRADPDREMALNFMDGTQRRAAEEAERKRQYDKYMKSEPWRAKRQLVLVRDRHVCQAKMPVCTALAIQVHHKTYDHLFNEPLFDLESVCVECHDEISRMDKQFGPREYGEAS